MVCSLSLFHWAHRFRYTLYDGLQIKHLNEAINASCYGGAPLRARAAGHLVWALPPCAAGSTGAWGGFGLALPPPPQPSRPPPPPLFPPSPPPLK